ncbi:DUF2147 domain-containing protein [Sphingomonas sp. CL5.1]|nr:DUF2147 domain-containing protein [Sphingomonas sp. CL5.1]
MRIAAVAALVSIVAPVEAQRGPALTGTWRNDSGSVRIRIAPCGQGLCGRVVAASEKAVADAARGGTDRLIGTELFHDFRREDDGLWYGQVYVPDIGQTFDGTLELVDHDTIVGKGCLFAGFGCKTQSWKRVR